MGSDYSQGMTTTNEQEMSALANNLINGNLSDAKEQAKSKNGTAISHYLRDCFGFSPKRAELASHYLKTGKGYQAYCDTI